MSIARYRVGDRVRTRTMNPAGHTRLPAYLRNREGVVEAIAGTYRLADESARGGNAREETLYTIAFRSSGVWGSDGGNEFLIHADLWESYLQ